MATIKLPSGGDVDVGNIGYEVATPKTKIYKSTSIAFRSSFRKYMKVSAKNLKADIREVIQQTMLGIVPQNEKVALKTAFGDNFDTLDN